MRTGEFLEQYFKARGDFSVKPNGEADVLCPFTHAKGLESRPSAHVNVSKGIFHCKTCSAEGRFNNGGLSEVEFFARMHNVTYEQAVRVVARMSNIGSDRETWKSAVDLLLQNNELMTWLNNRGITRESVIKYELGYQGTGVVYPVIVHGRILDLRTYNVNPAENEPKIKSLKEAVPLLMPFDHWANDDRPTVLHAGENDMILSRQMGFNALTCTMGEGSFPALLAGMFKDKTVYVTYDCDETGKTASVRVAFRLLEAGAKAVYLVDLGLSGTKDDKDFTDFVVKHQKGREDFQALLDVARPFSADDYQQAKNEYYPLLDLWNVSQGRYTGRRYSSRVIASGKYDVPLDAPSSVNWTCNNPSTSETSPCMACPLRSKSGWWTLEEENLHQVLELVEVTDKQQASAINRFIGLPPKCPGVRKTVRSIQRVQKVVLTPDVETEDILSGFKSCEAYAYVVGDHIDLDDGFRYRVFFRRYAHPLKGQQVWMVIDHVEESDSGVNAFKMTTEIHDSLMKYYDDPFDAMKERYRRTKEIVGSFSQEMVSYAVDLTYHSPLQFKFNGRTIKGYPEILVVGESRTGKSETLRFMQRFLGIGNFTSLKGASFAGIIGGADKLPSGGHKIKWGKVVRNHKGLLGMDEVSGAKTEVFAGMTDVRSSGMAILEKIVDGRAPAMTRLLWMGNPRVQSNGKSRNMHDYPYGVDVVLDLIGSDEDVARFDAVVLLAKPPEYTSPFEDKMEFDWTYREDYRNLVYWVWSRTAEQILWEEGVEQWVWHTSKELNELFDTDVKFLGAEAWKKLARIAVACAGASFSADQTGECIVVTKEHVDWAAWFLRKCYDNQIFRLREYAEYHRQFTTTTPEVNAQVANLINMYPMLMNAFRQHSELSIRQLQALSGLDGQGLNVILSDLARLSTIKMGRDSIQPTLRLRLAMEAYRTVQTPTNMSPA